MLISETMQEQLNHQIQHEFWAEHSYLAVAAGFERLGLKVFARVFWEQAVEEHGHAMRILDYLLRVGGKPELRGVGAARGDYPSVESMVAAALAAEEETTRKVHAIVALAEQEKDYSTRSFIQWKVDEQVEELQKMHDLVALVELAGPDNLLLAEARLKDLLAEWASAEAGGG